MNLAIIDYNKGQVPETVGEALEICNIYSRKDIVGYLKETEMGIHKVNSGGFVFGFCDKKNQEELQKFIDMNV